MTTRSRLDIGWWREQLLSELLEPGEEVVVEAEACSYWAGVVALTTRRLLFVRKRVLFGGYRVKAYDWGRVVGVRRVERHRRVDVYGDISKRPGPERFMFLVQRERADDVEQELAYRIGKASGSDGPAVANG